MPVQFVQQIPQLEITAPQFMDVYSDKLNVKDRSVIDN